MRNDGATEIGQMAYPTVELTDVTMPESVNGTYGKPL